MAIAIPKQSGFTLIELVVVIVILGVLAAFALPRFSDLSGTARRAKIEAAAGSIKTAAAIAHVAYLGVGNNPVSVNLDGLQISLVNGYPQASSGNAGILAAAGIETGADGDYVLGQPGGPGVAQVVIVESKGGTLSSDCSVSYTAPNAGAAPDIRLVTSGC